MLNLVWLNTLDCLLQHGVSVAPRDQVTNEILHRTIIVNMRKPVLTVSERKLNYKFMAAEAYWILSGDFRVETISPYNKNIAQFSDDGQVFFGAYGPKIVSQIGYVVKKLLEDYYTRQAGLTIWRENPPHTKDVPCTISIFFSIRHNFLHCHVFMRSSDVWLGIPYDVFNFSMLAHAVCAMINPHYEYSITPGDLHLTAASSHLYERDFEKAKACLTSDTSVPTQIDTPRELYTDYACLMGSLNVLRTSPPGDSMRWWETSE